jgi:NADH-quinone oxidoreductase subunit M
LLRFVLPLFPHASAEFAPIAMTLGLIGVFYGAWVAFIQTDIKRLVAYTSVSHMGFILIALYAGNLLTMQGLMVQMLAHGLSSAALFIMCGQIYERLHTRDLREMGGMWGRARYLPVFMMFFSAALLGIPGTGNFIGEFLILLGAFAQFPWYVVLATVSLVLAGLYSLYMIHQTLFGQPHGSESSDSDAHAATHDAHADHAHGSAEKSAFAIVDLNARELSMLITMAAGLIWLGFYPQTVLDTSVHTMQWVSHAYHTPLFPVLPTLTTGTGVH